MTSQEQLNANQSNAQQSTGPNDCSISRFNALKYGLSSELRFTKEEDKIINEIFEDLSNIFTPNNILEKILVGRMAVYVWRIQKVTNLEKTHFKNMLASAKNTKNRNDFNDKLMPDLFANPKIPNEELIPTETVDTPIFLILRYEVTNENRLIKLINFLKKLQSK